MCHQQQPAGVAGPALSQVAGQPGDAFDVQVVGGLVEGDHVPFADQQPGQLDPPTLATAERGNRCVPGDVGDQPADHVANPWVTRPLMLGLVAHQCPADGAVRVEGVRLAQRADPHSAAPGDPTRVGLQLTGQQTQQAGLAVAVAAHDADAGAVVHPERDRLEYHLRRIFQVYGFGSQQVRHRTKVTARAIGVTKTARRADVP